MDAIGAEGGAPPMPGSKRVRRTEAAAAALLLLAAALLFVPVWVDVEEGGRASCGSIMRPSKVLSPAGSRRELCEQVGAYQDRIVLVLVIAGLSGLVALVAWTRNLVEDRTASRAESGG